MGKDGIKRMAAAFSVCEAQQPFTGRIVGHCSSGLLVHGAGMLGGTLILHNVVPQSLLYMPQVDFALGTAESTQRFETWAKAGACVADTIILSDTS